MDQYNAELEHLGDHCHTSIIPDRYLKIPIYFLDIFFREKKVTHFIMCAAPKPKLFFPNAAFGEFAKRKVSGATAEVSNWVYLSILAGEDVNSVIRQQAHAWQATSLCCSFARYKENA